MDMGFFVELRASRETDSSSGLGEWEREKGCQRYWDAYNWRHLLRARCSDDSSMEEEVVRIRIEERGRLG